MTRFARQERAALADTMAAAGPEAPTLCAGWTARDLAAHVVLRERSPASLGITVKALHDWSERTRERYAAQDYARLLDQLRQPPVWSLLSNPLLDERLNLLEMYVHHEDVRRAQPDWAPRELDPAFEAALWSSVRTSVRLGLRRYRATLTIEAPGYGTVTAGAGGEPRLTVRGAPGELAVFVTGRQDHARVEVDGPAEPADRLRHARLGI